MLTVIGFVVVVVLVNISKIINFLEDWGTYMKKEGMEFTLLIRTLGESYHESQLL